MFRAARCSLHASARPRLSRTKPFQSRSTYASHAPTSPPVRRSRRWILPAGLIFAGSGVYVASDYPGPVRHTALAVNRASRIAEAVILGAFDYKRTLGKTYGTEEDKEKAYSACHTRSAKRTLRAMLLNGGVFIKLGQHISSLAVLPVEWTDTMKVLQDKCDATPYEKINEMFITDMGAPIADLYEDFDPNPIGVASLAQVHFAKDKKTGAPVAIKLQHPHLQEFCDIDIAMTEFALGWLGRIFPAFDFAWLASEMKENLPKEIDFVHEADNANRARNDFKGLRTSLYIPQVLLAKKRVLVMELIRGGRVDDLQYLADHNIDRNKVALEISRIFNQMVFVNGWFHADPHPGNLLIRPKPPKSKTPYNFEVVLLDHGLYFDIDHTLRVNYAKLWMALIAPASPQVHADRRKYAELVGNITPDQYPVFEAAITGRAAMEGGFEEKDEPDSGSTFQRAKGMMDMLPQSDEEMEAIRHAVVHQDGILTSVFDVLRRVPRRVLMVLKLNDLTRNLDHVLATTHASVRIFLITAKYCAYSVWKDDRMRITGRMRSEGYITFWDLREYIQCWWQYRKLYTSMVLLETWMDIQAYRVKAFAYLHGFVTRGPSGARLASAGISP